MPNYSYVHSGRLFDLILPKPLVDICMKANPGDCSQFQFVDSVDSVYDVQSATAKPTLSVTTLADGSWNLTNNTEPACSDLKMKHLYIIVTEQIERGTTEEVEQEVAEVVQEPELAEVQEHAENPDAHGSDVQELPENIELDQSDATQVVEPAEKIAAEPIYQEGNERSEETQETPQTEMIDMKPQINEDDGQEEYAYPSYVQEEAPEEDPGSGMDHDYMGPTEADELNDLSSEEELPSQEEQESQGASKGPQKKAVACSICPGTSKDYWNYLKHVKRYHTEHPSYWNIVQELKPLLRAPCKTCGKVFSTPKILLEHEQKVHSQSIGAVCTQCGKIFKSSHHLRQHIKYLHLRKAGTFLCDLCPAKFSTNNVLREHVKYSHSNVDRTNKCTECDFKYAFQKQFYEHFQRVHAPKKHICPHCDYKCATRWYMKKHIVNCAPKTSHMGGPAAKRQKMEDSNPPAAVTQARQEPSHPPPLERQTAELDLEQVVLQAQHEEVEQEHSSQPEVYHITETADLEELKNTAVIEEVTQAEIQQSEDGSSTVITTAALESNVISESAEGKRTRISLMGADGTQQTIEIIIPN